MFPQKNGDFYFFTLSFFAWKNIKTCLRGKIEGLNKEADCY